jgi:biopolymer transport protein ExbD
MKRGALAALNMVFCASGLGITGPAAAEQPPLVPPAPAAFQHRASNIVVRLSDSGVPSINDQMIPWARLASELKAIFLRRPEKVLFLQTAPQNRVEDVRRLVSMAKKQGVSVYAQFGN